MAEHHKENGKRWVYGKSSFAVMPEICSALESPWRVPLCSGYSPSQTGTFTLQSFALKSSFYYYSLKSCDIVESWKIRVTVNKIINRCLLLPMWWLQWFCLQCIQKVFTALHLFYILSSYSLFTTWIKSSVQNSTRKKNVEKKKS